MVGKGQVGELVGKLKENLHLVREIWETFEEEVVCEEGEDWGCWEIERRRAQMARELERRMGIPVFFDKNEEKVYPALVVNDTTVSGSAEVIAWVELGPGDYILVLYLFWHPSQAFILVRSPSTDVSVIA